MSSGKDYRSGFFVVFLERRGRHLEEVARLEGLLAAGPLEEGIAQVRAGECPVARTGLGVGLPGSVEVGIEQVSPATLVLRAAGQLRGAQVAATDAGS